MMRLISKLYFWLTGWKLEGNLAPEIKKAILIGAPHTSNFDFGYSRAALYMKCPPVLIKITTGTLGDLFQSYRRISVKRDKSENLVGHMVELFNRSEELVILLSPEGSRKLKGKWKTGFYHAALQAKVPIVLSSLDYKKKIAHVGLVFHPSGNYYQDMQQVIEYYHIKHVIQENCWRLYKQLVAPVTTERSGEQKSFGQTRPESFCFNYKIYAAFRLIFIGFWQPAVNQFWFSSLAGSSFTVHFFHQSHS